MNTLASAVDFEEDGQSLRDYINVLRRRKRVVAITAATVMAIVVSIAFLWPATYQSESIILIEQQDIPPELVRTTITSYAQQRIEEIKQRIMTIGNIMGIVEEFELQTESELERKTRTEIAQNFRNAVSISPISAEVVDPASGRPSMAVIAFRLGFEGDVPKQVQKVTSKLTDLFLDENLKERNEQTQSTSEFLTSEAKLLSARLGELDGEIATFKEQNKGALPELNQFNLSVVDRSELQISDLIFRIKEMEKQQMELEADLTQLSPSAPIVLPSGQAVLGNADRLKGLQSQLRQIEAAYSDDHPDVIRLRRTIVALLDESGNVAEHEETAKQLRRERDKLAGLVDKYTEDHTEIVRSKRVIAELESILSEAIVTQSEIKPDNPAYLVLQNRLRAVEQDILASVAKVSELTKKMERHEGFLSRSPQVEKEFQILLRDYQNTYQKYQEIRSKQMSAELAQSLESERKGERFTLIQPPELPAEPISPNRVALVLLGAILAAGAGLGAAILLESLDDSVYGVSAVVAATGVAPMVSISYMENVIEEKTHNRKRLYLLLGMILVGILSVILFHYFVKPLDVTWYVLLRKLGIQ